MNAPFFKFDPLLSGGFQQGLIAAFIIGIAFGFALERAGFGSSRKLAAQFYFSDLSVFKVMFTAIVTAMLGVFFLGHFGLLDVTLISKTPTKLVPQIAGGLLLGLGFVMGGYCPGTSVVAISSGKVDGLIYMVGIFIGLFGFAEFYDKVADFANSTNMGKITLDEQFGISYGIIVFAVVLMAVGGFMGAELAEKKVTGKTPGPNSILGAKSLITPTRILMAVFLFLGVAAIFLGSPYSGRRVKIDTKELSLITTNKANYITPENLADAIIQGDTDFILYDLRDPKDYTAYNITDGKTIGSTNIQIASPEFESIPRNENIILYAQDGSVAAQALIILKAKGYPSVRALKGGVDAWMSQIIFPPKPAETSKAALQAFAKKVVVAKYFGGKAADSSTDKGVKKAPTIAPPTITTPKAGGKRAPREGC